MADVDNTEGTDNEVMKSPTMKSDTKLTEANVESQRREMDAQNARMNSSIPHVCNDTANEGLSECRCVFHNSESEFKSLNVIQLWRQSAEPQTQANMKPERIKHTAHV